MDGEIVFKQKKTEYSLKTLEDAIKDNNEILILKETQDKIKYLFKAHKVGDFNIHMLGTLFQKALVIKALYKITDKNKKMLVITRPELRGEEHKRQEQEFLASKINNLTVKNVL